MVNALGSERFPIVGAIDPDAYTHSGGESGAYYSDWVDMALYDRAMFILMAGDIASSGTVNMILQRAVDASPLVAAALSPAKAITQLTQAGTDSNKQVIINVRADELGANDGYRWVRAKMTHATAAADAGLVILGVNARNGGNAGWVNALPSEQVAVVGCVDPDAYGASANVTSWVDMSRWRRVMAVGMAGDVAATQTVVATLNQATSSGGAGDALIAGKTLMILDGTATSPPLADAQGVLECRSDELTSGFRYIKGVLTVAGAGNSDSGLVLLGLDPIRGPASDLDAATVDEIVS